MNERLTTALATLPELLKKDLDQPLCVCNQVAKIDIIEAIVAGAENLSQVQQQTYAADGNGCCRHQVERLIEQLTCRD